MNEVRVVVATFGPAWWSTRAGPAVESAITQTRRCDVVHVHGDTLAGARNLGAGAPGAEWLVFLDADDQLDSRYVEAMLDADGDLRQPATLGVYPDGRRDPQPVVIPARRSIREGNWMVIGTMVRRDMFVDAGGFGDEPAWEDWALWSRCIALGAVPRPVPAAIYEVGVNPKGRNGTATNDRSLFSRILTENDLWARERGLAIR